jgi:hypothetical protein
VARQKRKKLRQKAAKKSVSALVESVRILLYYGGDPLSLVLRTGANGKLGLLGGKAAMGLSLEEEIKREVYEESKLKIFGRPKFITTLRIRSNRFLYPKAKLTELGFARIAGKQNQVFVSNPTSFVFSGRATGKKRAVVEGRALVFLDGKELRNPRSRKRVMKELKPRHRNVIAAWVDFVTKNKEIPAFIEFISRGES